jgi:urease accessory protein
MATDTPPPGFAPYASESLPGVGAGAPGKDGRLELTFAPDADAQTRLVRSFARAPFHLSGTLDDDPHPDAATVMVQSPTGGVGQGDRREATITVRPDAVARVTTGSATKVQSMTANYAASERTLSVAAGGHLDYVPRPTILHADARYEQTTTLTVADDASAVLEEVVVPGRLARGEAFAFDRYRSRVRVRDADGRLLCADTTDLTPDGDGENDDARRSFGGAPTAPGVLDTGPVWGTLFVVAPAVDAVALSDALHERASAAGPAQAGGTALPNDAGVLVRATGEDAAPVGQALQAAWDEARRERIDSRAPERDAGGIA